MRVDGPAYRLESGFKSLGTSGSPANDLPIVHSQLDTTGCSLAFLDFFNDTDNLNSALKAQVQGVNSTNAIASEDTLEESGTVSEDNEEVGLLGSESVDPTLETNSLTNELGHGPDFGLYVTLAAIWICVSNVQIWTPWTGRRQGQRSWLLLS